MVTAAACWWIYIFLNVVTAADTGTALLSLLNLLLFFSSFLIKCKTKKGFFLLHFLSVEKLTHKTTCIKTKKNISIIRLPDDKLNVKKLLLAYIC